MAMTWFGVAGPVAPKDGGYRNLILRNGRCPFPTLDHPVGATLGRPPMPAASVFPAPLGRWDVEDAVPYDWKMFNHDVGAGLPDGPARSAKRPPGFRRGAKCN